MTLTAALLASGLTLSTTACRTTRVETQVVVPEISFPAFPDPAGWASLDEETETVSMPLEYYARIFEYKVRVDEARTVYERIWEMYEGEKEK